MIAFPAGVKVWIAGGVTDMRCGMNSLALKVQEGLGRDPHGSTRLLPQVCLHAAWHFTRLPAARRLRDVEKTTDGSSLLESKNPAVDFPRSRTRLGAPQITAHASYANSDHRRWHLCRLPWHRQTILKKGRGAN